MADEKKPEAEVYTLEIVGGALDNAEPAPESPDPDPKGPNRSGASRAQRLPDDCPVTPVGVQGTVCFYLDAVRQLIGLEHGKHGKLGIVGLFGHTNHRLDGYWPRHDRSGSVAGFHADQAAAALIHAAMAKGVWKPLERQRGAGAWAGAEGELILHCGDAIWRGRPPAEGVGYEGGAWTDPGMIGDMVYPAAERLARPAVAAAADGDDGPAQELLDLISTWAWRRPTLDPILALGFIGAAMIGGALKWRPAIWITGGRGTGKSTFHDVLKYIMGPGGLVAVSDASAAGIWQALGQATLPVAFDELEAEEDGRRTQAVVKLMRSSSSGSLILRGGADHNASQFVARSSFLASSILVPPLQAQDRSRIAILELGTLPTTIGLTPDAKQLGALGASLRRRLVDGWPRFTEILEAYRAGLADAGHDGRGADQYGTLLALADIMLHEGDFVADWASPWIEQLGAEDLAADGGDEDNEQMMLNYLFTSPVDPYRGGTRQTIGEWVEKALGLDPDAIGDESNRILSTYGIKVHDYKGEKYLAIAVQHQGLAGLFERTQWAGRAGGSSVSGPRRRGGSPAHFQGARRRRSGSLAWNKGQP